MVVIIGLQQLRHATAFKGNSLVAPPECGSSKRPLSGIGIDGLAATHIEPTLPPQHMGFKEASIRQRVVDSAAGVDVSVVGVL